jgi:hypothetical protein
MDTNAIIAGGAPLIVTTAEGTEVEVLVRLLKIREYPDYLRLSDREEEMAAFITGRDMEFVDSLTADSVIAICEKAHDLNFQTACRWATRRAHINETLLPVAQKGIHIERTLAKYAPRPQSSSESP